MELVCVRNVLHLLQMSALETSEVCHSSLHDVFSHLRDMQKCIDHFYMTSFVRHAGMNYKFKESLPFLLSTSLKPVKKNMTITIAKHVSQGNT